MAEGKRGLGAWVRPRGGPWVPVLLRITVAAVLLYAILKRLDFSERSFSWDPHLVLPFVLAFGLQVVAQALSTLRWQAILQPGSPPWTYLFRLYLIGNFFSVFLPTSIGGDAVRAVGVGPAVGGKASALSSVILDRLFGVTALGMYLVLGAFLAPESLKGLNQVRWTAPRLALVVTIVVVLMIGGVLAMRFSTRWAGARAALAGAGRVVSQLITSPRRLATVLFLSLLVQATYILAWMGLAAGLGLSIPSGEFLIAVPIVSLGAMLPVSFGGLGVREGAWLLLLAPLGIPSADIVVYSLLYFLAFVLVGVVGGALFLVQGMAQPAPGGAPPVRPVVEGRPT